MIVERVNKVVQCVRVSDCVQDVVVMKFKSKVLVLERGGYIKKSERWKMQGQAVEMTLNKILRNNLGQKKGMGKTEEEKYGPRQMLIDVSKWLARTNIPC